MLHKHIKRICIISINVYLDFSKANIYADDEHTKIASSDIELIRMIKKEMLNISDWLRTYKQSVNPSPKNEFLAICQQCRTTEFHDFPSLEINDSEMKRV